MSVQAEPVEHQQEVEDQQAEMIVLLKRILVVLELIADLEPGESSNLTED